MRRYREGHDFNHCLLGMPTTMLGEVTVKVFEAIQLGLPMCWLAGLFGSLRLKPKATERYLKSNLPWIIETAHNSKPLINCYFEKRFEQSIEELRNDFNLKLIENFIKEDERIN
jgi:ubiquinone biosynthesis protein COQ4